MSDASKHPVRNSLLLGAAAIAATFALAGATGTLARKVLPEDPPEPPETVDPEVVVPEGDGGAVLLDPVANSTAPGDASAASAATVADAGAATARTIAPRTTVRRTTPRTTRVRTRSS